MALSQRRSVPHFLVLSIHRGVPQSGLGHRLGTGKVAELARPPDTSRLDSGTSSGATSVAVLLRGGRAIPVQRLASTWELGAAGRLRMGKRRQLPGWASIAFREIHTRMFLDAGNRVPQIRGLLQMTECVRRLLLSLSASGAGTA